MKIYKVTLFIMGLNFSKATSRVVEIEANSQDEAEELAHEWYISDGWGVYDSVEVREELTDEQREQAVKYADGLLSNIITDSQERGEMMGKIQDALLADIEDCADWQSLDGNEWCEGDVEIALARVLYNKICG